MIESTADALLTAASVIAAAMAITWVVSVIVKDASIIDPVWGLGFVIVAWAVALGVGEWPAHSIVLVAMVSAWGLRLATYLGVRNFGKGEDYRYQSMRRRWGRPFWLISFFTVYLLQGVLMWIVSLPVQAGIADPAESIGPLMYAGLTVWFVGLGFETVGDLQLARFRRNPESEGRVLDTGLWRYTRHPNYFGDFLVWWGIFLAAAAPVWTIVGPLVMSVLLLRVSGVTLLEKTITKRRPGYADYVRRTNAFFPWRPKDGESTRETQAF
jgi:steroid 5-alpha reductase family enzyme